MAGQFESKMNIRLLDVSVQKLASNFQCGNNHIDLFLNSPQALDDGFGKTYVWLEEDNKRIIGFYNISSGCVEMIEGDIRYKMGGSVHINEFALAQEYRGVCVNEELGINLSDLLLKDCLDRIMYIRSNYLGFSFVTLQSTEEGYNLYSRNDFEDIEEDMNISKLESAENECKPMYLPLDLED